jgi:hypothetical protein
MSKKIYGYSADLSSFAPLIKTPSKRKHPHMSFNRDIANHGSQFYQYCASCIRAEAKELWPPTNIVSTSGFVPVTTPAVSDSASTATSSYEKA